MNQAFEPDDLLQRLASESARQGKNLRTAVRNLTLKALQRRELTLEQIRNVLQSVTVRSEEHTSDSSHCVTSRMPSSA